MTSALGIATVTAVLKDLLNDGLANSDLSAAVGSVTVSALPPDRIGTGDNEPSRLNVFLYQVTANQGWGNAQLPARDGGGARVNNQPLALDLHYLLTAYGAADLDAEILLGYGMQVLHEMPVLTRPTIRKTFSVASPVTDKLLPASVPNRNAADLADQIELCKVTPHYLSSDELSRLWSAMQARYRPSVAYDISVVLIQSTAPARAALPVRRPLLTVASLAIPTIDRIEPPIAAQSSTITVHGSGLAGPGTKVRIAGTLIPPSPNDLNDDVIRVALPAAVRAGVNLVQVVHEVALGDPPVIHPGAGAESNVAALVVTPQITTATPVTVPRGAPLTLGVAPAVGVDQRVAVLIGEQRLEVQLPTAGGPPTTQTITVAVPAAVATGTYLLRVDVDGAVSPLVVDADPGHPTFQQFIGPLVEVT
jgi:hypothetical protein